MLYTHMFYEISWDLAPDGLGNSKIMCVTLHQSLELKGLQLTIFLFYQDNHQHGNHLACYDQSIMET